MNMSHVKRLLLLVIKSLLRIGGQGQRMSFRFTLIITIRVYKIEVLKTLFDPNWCPVRVPCSRWSWTTTCGWKSSLQLDLSMYPPAREITHRSLRWAQDKVTLSCCSAVSVWLLEWSCIPVISHSDVLYRGIFFCTTSAVFCKVQKSFPSFVKVYPRIAFFTQKLPEDLDNLLN